MPSMNYNILIHKYLTGDISPDEKLRLNEWLSSDPSNQKEFEEIKMIWETAEEPDEQWSDAEFQQEFQKLQASVDESRNNKRLVRRQRAVGAYKNALIITLLFAAFFLLTRIYSRTESQGRIRATNGENEELLLPDNSHIVLNDSSSFSFEMFSDRREGNIAGEALFEISKSEKPFIVKASDVRITVRGTSFVVKCYPDKPVEVIVVSGSVEVNYKDSRVILSDGERSVNMPGGIVKSLNEDPNFNSWYTGELAFDKTELADVLKLVGKNYKTTFRVTDPRILKCRFTGKFKHSKLLDIIRTLSFSLDIRFKSGSGNYYEVSGHGCS